MANSLAARRWWTIMPIVFITYSLAYLDRANYGFRPRPASTRTSGSARACRR